VLENCENKITVRTLDFASCSVQARCADSFIAVLLVPYGAVGTVAGTEKECHVCGPNNSVVCNMKHKKTCGLKTNK